MRTPADAIEELTARGHSVAEQERVLGLSAGYLSKVRHGAVRPSAQLVALLQVWCDHPEVLTTLARATGHGRVPGSVVAPAQPFNPAPFLASMAGPLAQAGVRWAVSGDAALMAWGLPPPAEPIWEVVVRERDRQALAVLRSAGAGVAHHGGNLSGCHPPGAEPHQLVIIRFAGLPPLRTCFPRVVERPVGTERLPVVDGLTTVLSCLLSRREGAEDTVAAALRHHLVTLRQLSRRLRGLSRLPATTSPRVLSEFDRDLAWARLRRLGRP